MINALVDSLFGSVSLEIGKTKDQIKKDMRSDKTVFDFYNSAYNDPESQIEKDIHSNFEKNSLSIEKSKYFTIYTYKSGKDIQSLILSSKLNFAIVVTYPIGYRDYIKTLLKSKIK